MLELKVHGIKKYMEATLVVNSFTLEAFEGDKVGIVGANGSGKSTVLKVIAGIEPMHYYPGYPQTSSPGYDEGLIHRPRGASFAYLEQMPSYPAGLKVIDVLNLAFEEVHEVEKQMREIEEQMQILEDGALEKALNKYSDMVNLYESKGGYEQEEKLSKVCTGLKFTEDFLQRDFDLLSGGEKTTIGLGKILIHQPDILLLDEPTNHLDMDSIEWLEGFLKNYKGIVLIVSHDRYFLDNVVNKIVEIEDMETISYRGNYSSFISQKEENMRVQYEQFREQQKKVNNMEKQVTSLRDWALRADNNKFFRRAASIQKKLDKLDRIDKPIFERRNMRLSFNDAVRSGNETIKAVGVSKRYEDKVIFDGADLMVHYGERVGLVGPNGSGKTTLLKMLLGEEQPDAGVIEFGANVMAAYLPQKIEFKNEELTLLECFREDISIVEGKAREYLAKFMFYKKSVFKKVKFLSGGERIRLKLAMLMFQDINLLILDEPTNHLDIDSIETLEAALDDFKGTIFFISHDRYFINKLGERVIAVEDFGLKSYPGNYDDYKREKSAEKEKAVVIEPFSTFKAKGQKVVHQLQPEPSAKLFRKIKVLEKEITELDLVMGINQDYEELDKLYSRKQQLNDELELAMEMWLKAGE
ncbi:ribosomal protection-like ABC-F family protein [Mesobacillus selenatarsenatis]|uniref:COG0488 ATPase components of ABC transporters with duplicated ATPase domains n=1 Tax=Mesobacillus selenatarsenatis (strain DSM 18680 / JCM 14380 / FERM P-15431 / SF-1) TaxID=1321606 RepID=A0A0A8XC69_MESS1|nr:ABC-F family ATP-binding cassette domain-containing protein [Mesobacillus selenatarsenatis]GAM15761.1 COG0488 ATPase components of ABC transporters with duplicated ATPase domains [Mesobacillus selenatarsenatis SF-1]